MKSTKIIALFAAAFLLLGIAACQQDVAPVVQGPCVSIDAKAQTLVIKKEADQKEITLDISQAKVGLTPQPGDILRAAYRKKDGKNMALKVMNMTKQDLMRK